MKSIFTLLFTLFSLSASYSQSKPSLYINGFPIDSIQVEYIEAETCNITFSNLMFLEIDFGQETKFLNNRLKRVADKNGDYIEFNSNMDALNHLTEIGFDLINTEYLRMKNDEIRVKYLLKKKSK